MEKSTYSCEDLTQTKCLYTPEEQQYVDNLKKHLNQLSLTGLLEQVAFFALLPGRTEFYLLKNTLKTIPDGEQKYQNFMEEFQQSPQDKDSYQKSIDVIKSKLLKNLYETFSDEIDKIIFQDVFTQKMQYVLTNILGSEPSKKIITNIIGIASLLIKRKDKEVPQIELLNKYLSTQAKELNLNEDFKIKQLIKVDHANDVYLVSNIEIDQDNPNTIDYYVKSFTRDERTNAKNGFIDPNELFAYKILEYTGFGPKCCFLMKVGAFSFGSINRGNFILTKNVGKGEGVNFLLDNEENQELFEQIFLNSKNFAIEISAAASINEIVGLCDTFKNSGNYGVVFYNNSLEKLRNNKDSDVKDYNLMFIDHLPNGGYGILHQLNSYKRKDAMYNTTKYSPRDSLISSHLENPNKLIDLAKNSKEAGFRKDKIIKDVYQRFRGNEGNGQQCDKFKAALEKAKEDVTTIIEKYTNNFYKSNKETALEILENYYKKILSNLEIFDEKYKEDTE